jgi:hypothetical protein
VTYRLNEWRNEHWSDTLESLDSEDKSLWKMTMMTRVPTCPSPLQIPGGIAPSDPENAVTLADRLEAVSAGERSVGPGSCWDG